MSRAAPRALLVVPLLLAGCASVVPDAEPSRVAVQALTQPHVGRPLAWPRSDAEQAAAGERVAALLARPLTADAAVELALLNNAGLQARLHDLGVTAAEAAQASRLSNPCFGFGRTKQGHEREIERGLHLNLARLLALPQIARLESARLEAVRREVAMDVLRLAADTRRAWVRAVAAEQALHYRRQVRDAAEAGAELARRMEQVGNFNRLARAREQAFHADAALGLAQAEAHRLATRERLVRLLGLWGDQLAFGLAERLPELPDAPRERPDIEREALAQRLDVAAARATLEQTAQSLGLTRATRWVNVLEIGAVRNGSNEAPRQTGWEVSLELPMFDSGDARLARAEHVYQQALRHTAAVAVTARSEVREAYLAYRSAWDIARHHRDEIVPLKKRISDEQLLRYNGMLIGVFELLADARQQIAAVSASLDAQRDFWLAAADLEQALVGRLGAASSAGAPAATPSAPPTDPGH